MLIVKSKLRGLTILSVKGAPVETPIQSRTNTAELDISLLQKYAEIGRIVSKNPIKIIVTELNNQTVRLGFEDLHSSIGADFSKALTTN